MAAVGFIVTDVIIVSSFIIVIIVIIVSNVTIVSIAKHR